MDEILEKKLLAELERLKEENARLDLERTRLIAENKRLKKEFRDWVSKNLKRISKKHMKSIIKDILNGKV